MSYFNCECGETIALSSIRNHNKTKRHNRLLKEINQNRLQAKLLHVDSIENAIPNNQSTNTFNPNI